MIKDEFRNIEKALSRMKRRYRDREISKREFIDGLKKLRVRDNQGRFWMIGVQTGQWYCFEGRKWTPSRPPAVHLGKAVCIHCGLENDLDVDVCSRCGGIVEGLPEKTRSGGVSETEDTPSSWPHPDHEGIAAEEEGDVLILKSIHPSSLFLVSGTLGAFFGLLTGVLAGSTMFFPGLPELLPEFLRDIQGKLLGGILFAAAGGILGFAVSGAAGWIAAGILNGILSLTGGLRFRADGTPDVPSSGPDFSRRP